jgi:parvulin-like peptidyl-prolyl isomerase
MIDARVLRMVAIQAVTVSDDAVEKEFQRGKRLIGSEDKFKEYLKNEELDEAGLRREIRDRLAVQEYTRKKTADLSVTDDEIKARYDQLTAEGKTRRMEKTADIQHIAVYAPSGQQAEKDAARKKVEDARARILAGEPFETVAREVSDDQKAQESGGLYPETPQSIMQDYLATRMFSQPVGELSEPFEGGSGWHLMKVVSVNEPGPIPMEKARDRVSRLILDSKKREAMANEIDRAKFLVHVEVYKTDDGKMGKQEEKKGNAQKFDPANIKMPTTLPSDLQKKVESKTQP